MISMCLTRVPISGLGEPNIYHHLFYFSIFGSSSLIKFDKYD